MFSFYRKQSIVVKLRILLCSSCLISILCFGVLYILHSASVLRNNVQSETINSTSILSSRLATALRFDKKTFAEVQLKNFAAEASYSVICLYNEKGEIFASFPKEHPCKTISYLDRSGLYKEETNVIGDRVNLTRNIISDGEWVGGITLDRTIESLKNFVFDQIKIMGLLTLITMTICYILSDKLQKLFSNPILELAENTQMRYKFNENFAMTEQDNLDEIGQLVNAFNKVVIGMENQYLEEHKKNEELSRVQNSIKENINAILGQFEETVQALHVYSNITNRSMLGEKMTNYAPYHHDIVESMEFCNIQLESFKRVTEIYETSLQTSKKTVPLITFLEEISKNFRNNLPFIPNRLVSNLNNDKTIRISIYELAWEELFNIISRLYTSIFGFVDFAPKLDILYDPTSHILSLCISDTATTTNLSLTEQFKSDTLQAETDKAHVLYKKNTVEDPEAGIKFLDSDILPRNQMQFILDSISYIGVANSIEVTHSFTDNTFTIYLNLAVISSNHEHGTQEEKILIK